MKGQNILWIILPGVVLLLAACSAGIEDTQVPESEIVQPSPESTATSAQASSDHQEAACDDPFGSTTPGSC